MILLFRVFSTIAFWSVLIVPVAAIAAPDIETNDAAPLQQDDDEECVGDDCENEDGAEDGEKKEKKKPKIKTIAEFIKGKKRISGLFSFYRDQETGIVYMEVTAEQLGPEYIYHNYVHSGVSGFLGRLTGLRSAGDMLDNYVISMRRRYKSIDIIQRNTGYVYDEDSTLGLGGRTNIPDSVMATLSIVAKNKNDTRFIVSANGLFKGKDLFRIGEASALLSIIGIVPKLNKQKSNIQLVRNYPENSEILSEYIFDFSKGAPPTSVIVQHSFARMPPKGFEPKQEDARIGYFTVRRTNLSTTKDIPYEDRIRRWRLEKKQPEAAISEPVKPITYWIENTTPHEYRDTIREAGLSWNPVFEAAGIKNAIEIKVQPDDATWDAGDIRYNVIQWVSSPNPLYSGYGPSIVNPRTGEILAANIVIEHNHVRRNKMLNGIFNRSGKAATMSGVELPEHLPEQLIEELGNEKNLFSHALLQVQDFAHLIALTKGAAGKGDDGDPMDRIIKDSLRYIVMHEIGHTLGLTHNMKASYYRSVEELTKMDTSIGEREKNHPTSGSVMDYPAPNILPEQNADMSYFPSGPGPYDYWAIRFGYDERMRDAAYRAEHLAKSGSSGLLFGNDMDAMRTPARGADPRIMAFDMSSQPVLFAVGQMQLIDEARKTLVDKLIKPGEPWDALVRANNILHTIYRQHAATISRYVGGVYIDRSPKGQSAVGPNPFVPVPLEEQKYAMAMLAQHIFAPNALQLPENLLPYLMPQRRGQSGIETPEVHSDALQIQSSVLDYLLHQKVLSRIIDSAQYGNGYTFDIMLDDLTSAIFEADMRGPVNIYRQNLQTAYVNKLLNIVEKKSGYEAVIAGTYGQVTKIDKMMRSKARSGDPSTRTHREYLRQIIKTALDGD
ncbi:zinc-dependent metalloprotease [Parasphingorhabdus cellanae]|uniref:Zinc-dependent metalloprotease n=1 Tax=Parasphingorhabdus cellanae TaxID=2806553 RepID=A0ABX7TA10_9SPHN|nr:zinc-dependent metalloprotease [Parasphingorhabdus cellanae]QTD57467.1 zinc-dependent metalloprotease [Parasphingorhabdus cellanae]